MAGASLAPELFRPALVVLGAAALIIPLFHRLRISQLIGFILIGVAVGPAGLGQLAAAMPVLAWITITDIDAVAPFGELGVVTLMFMIGLELSWPRLMVMRRLVFGLGGLQVVACAAAVGGAAFAAGLAPGAAAVVGLGLAMSSTAMVVQVLSDQRRLGGPVGRACLAVLLFQDLAAVPVLFVIGQLGGMADGAGHAGWSRLALTVGSAALVVGALLVFGRVALRRLLRGVARTGSPELFMAACLLVVLATGLATAAAGLSMAMGALIAGLLLAETEYRRQVEITIEPFKGLLLGVFLIWVGMGLDIARILADPLPVLALALLLVAAKAALIFALARLFRLPPTTGLQAALLLAPGGEFGFVILAAGLSGGMIAPSDQSFVLVLAAVTMAAIPPLGQVGAALGRKAVRPAADLSPPDAAGAAPRVILAGFGRVGETVAAMLDIHRVAYVAIDNDTDRVARLRAAGKPVYWGDITRVEMLRNLRLDAALALVVTMNDHEAADLLVVTARAERADLQIIARARDADHAAHLYAIGATDAVPETIEASLQLSEAVLVDLGIAMGPVIASIHEKRAEFQAQIRTSAPDHRPRGRRRLRDAGR